MAYCETCGAPLEDGASFCTECGAPVTPPSDPLDELDQETLFVEAEETRRIPDAEKTQTYNQSAPSEQPATYATAAAPRASTPPQASQTPPPTMPAGYPEQPPNPRRQLSTVATVGIAVGSVLAVLIVAFGIFYFANPLGLTTGIFANSAAAQEEAAAAQAAADEAAAAAEAEAKEQETQKQIDDLKKQLEEAQNNQNDQGAAATKETKETVVLVPTGGSSGSSASASGSSAPATSSGAYILPTSSTSYLSTGDISGLSNWQLCLARNEIYARHHRLFNTDSIQNYFNSQPWYDGYISPEAFSDGDLNEVEAANVQTILGLEQARGSEYL